MPGRTAGTTIAFARPEAFMDAKMRQERTEDDREPIDPGPDTVDPAPLLGQVGEGATLESGEAIAREFRKMTEAEAEEKERTDTDAPVSADPEMPIPSPEKKK
jgi:hypothetical protein